ncbi:hypothetical protein BDQ17DRAFT_1544028 [Cyathus striatus]|nr:hypothetical protein BDQ17DRAFT_1544028 [Cyathus striatus]
MHHKHNRVVTPSSENESGEEESWIGMEEDTDDSDEENLPIDLNIVIPGPQANREVLHKGLRSAQLKVSKLYRELKKVHKEKATLEAMKPRTHCRLQCMNAQPNDDSIMKAGRHFTYMNEVWMCDAVSLAVMPPDPDFDNTNWNSAERYTNPETQMEGIRRDLRMVVPPFLYGSMIDGSSDHFITKFDHGMQQQRSNAAECGKYNLLPPIFYPKWNTKDKCVFTSNVLLDLSLCLLRGPSALRAKKEGKYINMHTVAKQWGLTTVTPGFIALVAILTRFGLSGDPEFVPVGESGITYTEDFKAYKLMLYKYYNKPSIQSVFKVYNDMIFPSQLADKDSNVRCDDTRYIEFMACMSDESESEVPT